MAQDNHHVLRFKVQLDDALQAGIHRLHKAGAIIRDSVRDLFHPAPGDPIHDAHILREASAGRLVPRRDADLLVDQALRVELVAAVEAFPAGDVMEDDHPIAG